MPELSIEQQRARDALGVIRELDRQGPKAYGNYVSYASALPAQIIMNGLGQALVTLMAAGGRGQKRSDPHFLLYMHLASWLSRYLPQLNGEPETLIDRLVASDESVYLVAHVESLAYLNWLRKFARGILQEKEAGNTGSDS